jgi:hypothetical protein
MFASLSNLRRAVTSTFAAGAVALAGLAAPTPAAANDDLIKFLLGATALAVVVHSAKKGNAQVHVHTPAPQARTLPAHCLETLRVKHRDVQVYNAHCLQQAQVWNVPDRCYEVVRTNHGNRGVYRAQCLIDAGWRPAQGGGHVTPPRDDRPARALPQSCEIRYRARGELRQGYDAACLRDAGLRRLPESCIARRTDGQVYNAECLIDAGYRRR